MSHWGFFLVSLFQHLWYVFLIVIVGGSVGACVLGALANDLLTCCIDACIVLMKSGFVPPPSNP